jgi:hypothetical protein
MRHTPGTTRLTRLTTIAAALLVATTTALASPAAGGGRGGGADDPLPSWREGAVKHGILDFVERATTPGRDFVPEPERIATFDNDGTLWQEKPVVQGAFVIERLRAMVAADPSLAARPDVRAALDGDLAYFSSAGEQAVMGLFALTSAGMDESTYAAEVRAFFVTARHPTLGALYKDLVYQPMLEVLRLLRAHGFKTYVCSGGGVDFMREVTDDIYGIPREQVIGSTVQKRFVDREGRHVLFRLPAIGRINDKDGKPVGIDLVIGKRPVFAAGNVRSGGDIAMLTYSKERAGLSHQLLVNHDDAVREFAYSEPDGASLTAAAAEGWSVVSMRDDWLAIFPPSAPQR